MTAQAIVDSGEVYSSPSLAGISACAVGAKRRACEQPEPLVRMREVPKLARKSPSTVGKPFPPPQANTRIGIKE